MKSVAILSLIGLAAALPEGPLQRHQAFRRNSRPVKVSHPMHRNATMDSQSSNWGGYVHDSTGISHVEGTVQIPAATGGSSQGAAIWVGIDGDTCQTSLLQTGVTVYGDGTADAWVEWIPDYSHTVSFSVNAGDTIYMAVDATSTTTGTATLENLTTGEKYNAEVPNPYDSVLCQEDAEWIVEDFEEGSSPAPFADFGTVTFTDCSATGSDGTFGPSGGEKITLVNAKGQEAVCSNSGSSVTCTYEN